MIIIIAKLPAHKAGLTGHVPVKKFHTQEGGPS